MPKVTFIEYNGTEHCVEVGEGVSLMEAAISNLIPGIDGDCGGNCACATCHLHIDAAWLDKLPEMHEQERSMLEVAADSDISSRLGCQIRVTSTLDGIVVRTPQAQH